MNHSFPLSPLRSVQEVLRTETFPSVSLPAGPSRVPVEVSLVARLGHGAGDKLFFEAVARQRMHEHFVDAHDEPSARLGGTHFKSGDATALYSFGVGHRGHPFHKHAGHRVFTAVSGSGGAQLRFSSVTYEEMDRDPQTFVDALRHVNIPPDCLFTVRFAGDTWHQFVPLHPGSSHPALFALSTHTNELGGRLSESVRRQVLEDRGDIPSLTELLPPRIVQHLSRVRATGQEVPTTTLSLGDKPGGLLDRACLHVRSWVGHLHRIRVSLWTRTGSVGRRHPARVKELGLPDQDSLLHGELLDRHVHHQDCFAMTVNPGAAGSVRAEAWLVALLEGFMENQPKGVSRLMALRNWLVRPLKLRVSPLGCPVSSLLGPCTHELFSQRFPVRAQHLSADGRHAQVVLGADDRHLMFRSCVEVRLKEGGTVQFSLSNRVTCLNSFGRFYMRVIDATHRQYIAPAMLAHAVEAALASQNLQLKPVADSAVSAPPPAR